VSECRNLHQLEEVPGYHHYIRTETDANAYRLIRFIRNAVAHCFDLEIENDDDRQDLYKQIVVIMVYLVHFLFTQPEQETKHLEILLEKNTIKQLILPEDLLIDLKKPCDIPEILFNRKIDFNTTWYQRHGTTRRIDFNNLSHEFIEYFTYILTKYFHRRLDERKTPVPWSK
jgi:hypothetical protein